MTGEEYRDANSYENEDGERHPALTLTFWDVLLPVLSALRNLLSAWIFLLKGHSNLLVERKAAQIELHAWLETTK